MGQLRADLLADLLGVTRNADNVGRVAKKAVNIDVTGKLAKGAADKGEVSASMIQQLAMSENAADRAMLQSIVSDMPPDRLDAILVKAFRDPASPKDAPTLTPQGQMIADVARGGNADPALTKTAAQGGGDTGINEVDVGNVSDLPPKSPPYAPKTEYTGKELSDDPKFHVKERVVNNGGQTEVRTPEFDKTGKLVSPKGSGSASVDSQTAAAVKTAARGGTPKPIGDTAALKNSRSQLQNYSSAIGRLAGLVDPRGVRDMPSPGFGPGMADKAVSGGVPGSALRGAKPKPKRTAPMIAAESVVDYDEITRLAKEAGIDISLASTDPEGFARALVAKADQGMFDATPLTARQRSEMKGASEMLSGNEATSGPALRAMYPDEAAAGTMAGRQGSVQQQAIEAITRKIRDNFNSESMPIHEGTASAAPAPYKQTEGETSQFGGYKPNYESRPVQGPQTVGDEGIPVQQSTAPPTGSADSGAGPAGDLTGSNAEIAAMRAAERAPVVKNVSANQGREFTSRRVAEIESEMSSLSRNDPRYRELGIELRDAKLIDSYLEPHKRMISSKTLNQATANATPDVVDPMKANAHAAASKPAATVKQAPPPKEAPKAASQPAEEPAVGAGVPSRYRALLEQTGTGKPNPAFVDTATSKYFPSGESNPRFTGEDGQVPPQKGMSLEEWKAYTRKVDQELGSNHITPYGKAAITAGVFAPPIAVQQFFAEDDEPRKTVPSNNRPKRKLFGRQ